VAWWALPDNAGGQFETRSWARGRWHSNPTPWFGCSLALAAHVARNAQRGHGAVQIPVALGGVAVDAATENGGASSAMAPMRRTSEPASEPRLRSASPKCLSAPSPKPGLEPAPRLAPGKGTDPVATGLPVPALLQPAKLAPRPRCGGWWLHWSAPSRAGWGRAWAPGCSLAWEGNGPTLPPLELPGTKGLKLDDCGMVERTWSEIISTERIDCCRARPIAGRSHEGTLHREVSRSGNVGLPRIAKGPRRRCCPARRRPKR